MATFSKDRKQLMWEEPRPEIMHSTLVGSTNFLFSQQLQELNDLVFDIFEQTLSFHFVENDIHIYVNDNEIEVKMLDQLRWFTFGWLQAQK